MAEPLPSRPVLYPETDGQPMPDGDYQGEAYRYVVPALQARFRTRPDVYASGDLFIYLEKDNPGNCIAPDAFVVLGAANHRRETYRLWEEPAGVPDFVLEIVSPSTWRTDLGAKREKYASLGVREYWLHDPHGRHLQPALAGYRLEGSAYVPLPAIQTPGGIAMRSDVLGLELHLDGDDMRLFDPVSGEYLPNFVESEAGRRAAEARGRATEADLRKSEAGRRTAEADLRVAETGRRTAEADLRAAKTRIAELERAMRQRRGE